MNEHYHNQISAFLDRELSKDEQARVGEHIMNCASCREEHDKTKAGRDLAKELRQADAPEAVWTRIRDEIGRDEERGLRAAFLSTSFRREATAAGLVAAAILITLGAIFFIRSDPWANAPPMSRVTQSEGGAWRVESTSGDPKIGNGQASGSLAVGGVLETDEISTARIKVANIGEVDVSPNSVVKLVNTSDAEHRLALERGKLSARIYAPPRLFVVDTPTAAAVDLGCAYTLEVDEEGSSRIHVTSGYVSLERDGVESFVPMGAYCETRKGKGIGTPFFGSASAEFKRSLADFDFGIGGNSSLTAVLDRSTQEDTLTLWHLLSRVNGEDRRSVLKKIEEFMILSDGITASGLMRLDKNMLLKLRDDLEILWYESYENIP